MTDTLPDRLSADPNSPFYNEELLNRGVGIRFKGVEKDNILEYCISEQWVRVTVSNTVKRDGTPMTMKLSGPVEAYVKENTEETK
ncbi:unnamed protein product [Commensalibacter communis]|uniref:Glutathione peroxidase n=1 Tax=Commensalibacter communis TaxID=2972786 RepID=A0A9W4TR71_9PROT|nr:DUF3297 family protein [Commensalibacter communis]CAI3939711.1 unnamed protein product [Commensalibacter communis]CAI3940645.1 unnamed protein product [Commensalibacter communis]CAI3942840.1 unnamed protein product [Commensalibacter communis]CAI3946921.1 unnamed protein product [Commensalibacter communis]CAI3947025.1 unnamed protein product [Commensalibacter communis]